MLVFFFRIMEHLGWKFPLRSEFSGVFYPSCSFGLPTWDDPGLHDVWTVKSKDFLNENLPKNIKRVPIRSIDTKILVTSWFCWWSRNRLQVKIGIPVGYTSLWFANGTCLRLLYKKSLSEEDEDFSFVEWFNHPKSWFSIVSPSCNVGI